MTSFQQRFQSLDTWLKTHTQLWQFDTFARLDNPWKTTYPELSALLEQESLEKEGLEKENESFYAEVFRLCPDLKTALNFSIPDLVDQSPQRTLTNDVPSYVSAGIKGRKWSQIQAFVAHTPKANNYVEWCAGKGHLGKLLAFQR